MRNPLVLCAIALLAIGSPAPDVVAQSSSTPELDRLLDESDKAMAESLARLKIRRWAPAAAGKYVALSELKVERWRIQPAAWASDQGHAQEPFPRFTVVLTLGVSSSKDAQSIREAFFHATTFAEASMVMQDLKANRVKAIWMERFEVVTKVPTEAGKWWWEIRGLEY